MRALEISKLKKVYKNGKLALNEIDLTVEAGDLKIIKEKEEYTKFYMHKSGHWLGLDVHDAGPYKKGEEWIKLQENMVFTIEPGIYIAQNDNVDKKWWNIGVRIEDDILVTKNGAKNLSEKAPKEIHEIEKLIHDQKF